MVEFSPIASTVLMGALLIAVVAVVTRSRSRHPSLLARRAAGGGLTSTGGTPVSERVANSRLSWVASFVLVTFGALGAVLVVVTEGGSTAQLGGAAVATLVGLLLGTYVVARNAGLKNAWATMVTALVVGILLLVAITAVLLTG